jgi:hypothetical protein
MNTDAATIEAIDSTLATLAAAKVITWSKINDSRARLEVTVTVPVVYEGSDPNGGYDDATNAAYKAVEDALAVHGLWFDDAGVEEDGSGEYWLFRAAIA